MNLRHKSTHNLKIPGARGGEIFSPLPLLRVNGEWGFWIEAPCLIGYISLLCKWMLGFYLVVLNTWAQVLLDESQLIEVYTEWNIRLGK